MRPEVRANKLIDWIKMAEKLRVFIADIGDILVIRHRDTRQSINPPLENPPIKLSPVIIMNCFVEEDTIEM